MFAPIKSLFSKKKTMTHDDVVKLIEKLPFDEVNQMTAAGAKRNVGILMTMIKEAEAQMVPDEFAKSAVMLGSLLGMAREHIVWLRDTAAIEAEALAA